MSIVSHLHHLFDAETCQSYIHTLRGGVTNSCAITSVTERSLCQSCETGVVPLWTPRTNYVDIQ